VLLFQNHFKTAFEQYITPGLLTDVILFFSAITATLVIFTYSYLGAKKRSFFYKDRIKKNLELWISNVILDESEHGITIPDKFRKLFKNPAARQYAIENLIINKKAFSGSVADNIRFLYEEVGFKEDSLRKLNSKLWFMQAKGIQELALMDQNDQLIKVYRLTNSKNDFVRNEAQSAIIHWSGFNGLRFLDVATYTISEWQQVQLLVQLRNFAQQDMPKMAKWLTSTNDSVVLFALKLCEVYQQFHVKQNVAACLQHSNEAIRKQTVRTLCRIGDSNSADWIVAAYPAEPYMNQLNILNNIQKIATEQQVPFLQQELDNENDFLKLAAARALGSMGYIHLLEEKATASPELYQPIYQHIQAEILL